MNTCTRCRVPADLRDVVFRQNIGLVLLRLRQEVRGRLCSDCVDRVFRETSLVTLFLGWWGIVSFIVTPVILAANLKQYLDSQPMAPAHGSRESPSALRRWTPAVLAAFFAWVAFSLAPHFVWSFRLGMTFVSVLIAILATLFALRRPASSTPVAIAASSVFICVLMLVGSTFNAVWQGVLQSAKETNPPGSTEFRGASEEIEREPRSARGNSTEASDPVNPAEPEPSPPLPLEDRLPRLLEAIQAEDFQTRYLAETELEGLAESRAEGVSQLIRLAGDKRVNINGRCVALHILGKLGTPSAHRLPLASLWDEAIPHCASEAIAMLEPKELLLPEVVEGVEKTCMAESLSQDSMGFCFHALRTFVRIESPAAAPVVIAVLQSRPDDRILGEAMRAAGAIGPAAREVIPILRATAQTTSDTYLRQTAIEALARIESR